MTTARPQLKQSAKREWYLRSAEEVLAHLGSPATGLSLAEAAHRLATDGPNELKEGKCISPLQIFRQFKSLIIWILIAAGVISGCLWLFAIGAIPLVILEMVKVVRHAR